jgi:GTP-binding protein
VASNKVPIVAIVGRANVGKSSLFNAVLGRREAIVADEPGTTRDSVTAKASWEGKDFWLVDTAGLKSPDDAFELTIQEQIAEAAEAADLIAVVVEADVPITEEDRRVATMALKSRKPVVLIINKADKNKRAAAADWQRLGIKQSVLTSAAQRNGIDDMLNAIAAQLPKAEIKGEKTITVSLVGRPNVGKSSLFNALAKKQQAIVADKAGTTRDVNRTTIRYKQLAIELADTAGIRRSGKIERGVEHFSVLRAHLVVGVSVLFGDIPFADH